MNFLNVGGLLARGVNGYQEGVESVKADQARDADTAFRQDQQQRTIRDQKRLDDTRDELSKVATTDSKTVATPTPNDDDGNPMPVASITRPRAGDAILRDAAGIYQKHGDLQQYLAATAEADKQSFSRSSQQFQQLSAAAPGMSTLDLANAASKIYNDDSLPGKVDGVRDLGGGAVAVTLTNKLTGASVEQKFANQSELLTAMQAYYSPDSYAKLQAMHAEIAAKAREKLNEPQKLSPGQELWVGGKKVGSAAPPAGSEYVGDGADGNPIYRRFGVGGMGGGTGSGAGGAGGKAPADPASAVDTVAKESETKFAAPVYAQARRLAAQVTDGGRVPAPLAAEVAITVAADPTKAVPAVDPKTGVINTVYTHPEQGEFVIGRNVASANDPKGLKPETLQGLTAAMVASQAPDARDALVKAAFDPTARAALLEQANTEIDKQYTGPQAEQVKRDTQASIDRKLSLISKYGQKPKAPQQPGSGLRLFGGGMGASKPEDPNSPAGRVQARVRQQQDQVRAADEQRALQQRQLSTQFQQDKATMPPLEFVRKYDALRSQLPTSDAADLQAVERQI